MHILSVNFGKIISIIWQFLTKLGASTISILESIGGLSIFTCEIVLSCFSAPFYFRRFLHQIVEIFFYSLFVIGLTGLFTGAVLALQSYNGLSRLNVESAIPTLIVLSLTRELGPVLSGLMCAGRVSGAIAAEVGSMQVSNQIASMQLLSVSPLKFLIAPRLWAGIISLPVLTIVANIIGILGGYLVCTRVLGFSSFSYIDNVLRFFKASDLYCGLIKATVFGFIIIIVGSYCGYRTKGGSQGVGAAATSAAVFSSVLILTANYLLTALLF